jgi:hypothetical protein
MRVDLLYHYIGGSIIGKGFELLGLSTTDNAILTGILTVGKELADPVFCWADLLFSTAGWIVTVL